MWMKVTIPLAFLVLLAIGTDAQQRRVRLRARPIQQVESAEEETSEEAGGQQVIQYYRPQPKQDDAQELVYVNEEEYQSIYGQSTQSSRPRDYRPAAVTTIRPHTRTQPAALQPRTKEPESKAPPVQTIRNYNKVNDDGSFTFGYEAADGSFKEETRGTDCVVRGRYGYVDPEVNSISTGNKREFTYVSGNPCDPNNPDGSEEEERTRSEEELENENVPQNYPKRPIAQAVNRPRPTSSPTTRAPTTVFQNRYNHQSLASEEEEDDGAIQFAQIPKTSPRTFVQSTPRPRIQQTQPPQPATTYRPQTVSYVTPKPAHVTTPAYVTQKQHQQQQGVTFASGSSRGALDFDAEFKKFTSDNSNSNGGFVPVTPSSAAPQTTKSVKISSQGGSNPIYQTRLVYNPSSGQYDSALYQSIAQTDSDFQLNQRIQPYQQQYQQPQQYQFPQQQAFRTPIAQPQTQTQSQAQPQVPQQIYQKQQNELQFVNSQQLFAQQLQMQQSQLHRDRLEASKKQPSPAHRFQLQQAEQSPILQAQLRGQPGQQFYYIQPQAQQSGGQIEAFLRGHNLEY